MKRPGLSVLSIVALLTALSACALPPTTVRTGSEQPSLVVKGAPSGTELYVDGLEMGPAAQFDGNPNVLAVWRGATWWKFAKAMP